MEKQYHGININDLYNALSKQFNFLVDDILQYESDTFSSSGYSLTPKEAEQIAIAFILEDIEGRHYHNTMDGGMILEKLDDIRTKELE